MCSVRLSIAPGSDWLGTLGWACSLVGGIISWSKVFIIGPTLCIHKGIMLSIDLNLQ